MVMQWAPKAGESPERRFYSVQRDIAYIGPPMIKALGYAIEEKFWEPWFRNYMRRNGLTYEDLIEPARKFLQAALRIIHATDPPAALAESGFDAVDPVIQLVFYGKLGQVFLAGVWSGVKDVSRPDSDPPVTFDEMFRDIDEQFTELLRRRRHGSDE